MEKIKIERVGKHKLSPKTRVKYTAEEKAEIAFNKESNKNRRAYEKEQKLKEKELKVNIKRELNILKFMLKNDVFYHHHGRKDSMKKTIQNCIDKIKVVNNWQEYNAYIWNYFGQGKNMMSISLMGNLFDSREFNNIYEVPLDGTYTFIIYDSGHRGSGSFDYIKPIKIETKFNAPKVNPGGFPPITC